MISQPENRNAIPPPVDEDSPVPEERGDAKQWDVKRERPWHATSLRVLVLAILLVIVPLGAAWWLQNVPPTVAAPTVPAPGSNAPSSFGGAAQRLITTATAKETSRADAQATVVAAFLFEAAATSSHATADAAMTRLFAERSVLLEAQRQLLLAQLTSVAGLEAAGWPGTPAPSDAVSGGTPVAAAFAPEALATQLAEVEIAQTAVAGGLEPPLPTTPTVPAPVITSTLATSAGGTPIQVVRLGRGPHHVVLIGGIHAGAAPNSVELAKLLVRWFTANDGALPLNTSLFVIPNLNPDSQETPSRLRGRYNANAVDLGSNWGCEWTADPRLRGVTRAGAGGQTPLSEPETRALVALLQHLEPVAVVFWDAPAAGGSVRSDSCTQPNAAASALARAYADAADYYELAQPTLVPGDPIRSLNESGIPTILVMLPGTSRTYLDENLAGVRAVLEQLE